MELKDYYRLIIRHLPTVIVSTIVGTLIAGLYSFLATPVYQAKAQLFVSTPSSALDVSALVQGSSFSQQRVKSYAQIINGPTTLEPVIKNLGLNISSEKLAKQITATAPLDTVLINITVSNKDKYLAARIANAVGNQFAITANTLESTNAVETNSIKVTMVKTATVPTSPYSPKKALNLILGLILGFGLGLGIAILRQIFDNTIKGAEQLGETPILTAVMFDKKARKFPVISKSDRYSVRTEAFRQLRTNVQFIRADNPPKIVAITSALPGEGKTTSSINLAIMFAQAGLRTLLIEGDLRRPKVSEYLSIDGKENGLSELLNGMLDVEKHEDLLSTFKSTENANLYVMPTGKIPPNPSELLNSPRFAKLIEKLRNEFDYVIIDCPPLLPVTDAALITTKVDGAVIVIKAGDTNVKQFEVARDSIISVGAHVLGVALNMIPTNRTGNDYGYGYGYGYKSKSYSYSGYSPEEGKNSRKKKLDSKVE